jgi:hypothetical protein
MGTAPSPSFHNENLPLAPAIFQKTYELYKILLDIIVPREILL